MKLGIMTDIEGVAGVMNYLDWCIPQGRYYEKGKRLLTEEVNACIDGLLNSGEKEIIVFDGHGHGGIDHEILHEKAYLQRGWGKPAYPLGLDESFSAICYVGQHAKAGTPFSHLTHTQSFSVIDDRVNGISIGEYGQFVLCAKELGIPTILACGEKAFVDEAEDLTPGVVGVYVKQGLLPDGLDDVDTETYSRSKLSAIHCSVQEARQRIKAGAIQAIKKLEDTPQAFQYKNIKPPYSRITKYRKNGNMPAKEQHIEHESSFISLMNIS